MSSKNPPPAIVSSRVSSGRPTIPSPATISPKRGTLMRWYHYVAYFFGGAFLANTLPHLINGVSGNAFQSPFASPPGVGLSSSMVNVLWGLFNLAIAYLLICRVGGFDLRKTNTRFSAASWDLSCRPTLRAAPRGIVRGRPTITCRWRLSVHGFWKLSPKRLTGESRGLSGAGEAAEKVRKAHASRISVLSAGQK